MVPPQLIGPKLLTALHNVVGFPLSDAVGMASPLVLRDLAAGGGPALDVLLSSGGDRNGGFNLCSSLIGTRTDGVDIAERMALDAIDFLKRGR